jgi:hypothetical protein
MRIIIEIEGGGPGQPEVVLRSTSPGQSTADVTGRVPGATSGGGIDAGAAPTGDSSTQALTLGSIITPSISATDAAGANSAGAAPSPDAGG